MTTRFNCKSGDGAFLNVVTQLRHNVGVLLHIDAENNHAEADAIIADPATADAIASAIHVAAAQVRKERGEAVEWRHVEHETMRSGGDMCCINGPTVDECDTDFVLIARADVQRLIAELGAWLAAHEVAK